MKAIAVSFNQFLWGPIFVQLPRSKVYVHITGLKNGSIPVDQHQINLKKCSITDGNGQQEIFLIQGYPFLVFYEL